jgi:3-dehydroquinate dehydratase I
MADMKFLLEKGHARVVGSLGCPMVLRSITAGETLAACDLVEIRLDLLAAGGTTLSSNMWDHLTAIPLLFTARRSDEGGNPTLTPATRMKLLESTLEQAACLDVEVASIVEMEPILREIQTRGIPWVASFHDFEKLPESGVLERAAERARQAGAAVFKAAAWLHSPAEMARLAEFQLADHGLPVATMGMGPLATVSRLLCAQYGSVLNYGYLGKNSTAPGQLSAEQLKFRLKGLPSLID